MLADYRVRIFSFSVEYNEPRNSSQCLHLIMHLPCIQLTACTFLLLGDNFLNSVERAGVDHSAPSGIPEGLCRQVNPGQALSGDIGVCFESL